MKLCFAFHRDTSNEQKTRQTEEIQEEGVIQLPMQEMQQMQETQETQLASCCSTDRQNMISEAEENLRQMKVLEDLAKSKKHRHLLKHPVLNTYLNLKWEQIRPAYWAAFFLFSACVFVTNLFVLAMYGGASLGRLAQRTDLITNCSSDQSSSDFPGISSGEPVLFTFWICLILVTLVILVKIVLQFWMAGIYEELLKHIWTFETWMEMFLFFVPLFALCISAAMPEQNFCHMRRVAAVSLISSWILLLNMFARTHRRHVHVIMFFHVTKTFVWIFLLFTPYILAFGLFFYVSLHQDVPKSEEEEAGEQGTFFDKAGFSIFKTVTMFVGELEFSDIPFDGAFSELGFLVFVLLVVIVLMNLLTGLAVS